MTATTQSLLHPKTLPVMTPRRTALIGALIVAIGPMSLSLYSPALPALVKVFGTTPSMLNLTMTTYFFGYAFSQLVCGPLSDGYGRRSVALSFFSLYLVGSIIAIIAPNIHVLLAARIIQGVGVAAGAAVSRALVRDQFTGLAATKIMNLIALMLAVGPAVSPMLGGMILGAFGWHWIFLAMALYGVVILLTLWLATGETNLAPDPARARPIQVVRNYASLMGNRAYITPVILLGCTVGSIYTLSPLMPFVLIEKVGLSSTGFGLAMLAQTGSYALGSFCTARLLKYVDEKTVVRIGMSFVTLAGFAFALGPRLLPLSVPLFVVPVGVLAFGMAVINPSVTTRALSGVGAIAGAASAFMGFAQIGCGLLGSAVAAAFFHDPVTAYATIVPAELVIALAMALIMPKTKTSVDATDVSYLEDLEVGLDPAGVLGASGDEIEARARLGSDRR